MEAVMLEGAKAGVLKREEGRQRQDRQRKVSVKLEHVRKVYRSVERHEVFRDVSLEIKEGEFLAIAGPIGSGKTTLINIIAGLDRPTSGRVSIQGVDVTNFDDKKLTGLRAHNFGIVHQVQNLIPEMTVEENLELPLLFMDMKKEQREAGVKGALERLGIAGHARRVVGVLSVGERQMVAIARALASDPPIILMDEPVEALDPMMAEVVLNLLRGDNIRRNKTLIITTHDKRIMSLAHRVIRAKKRIP